MVLLEVQSRWDPGLSLRLLGYEVRYRQKTGLSVLGAMVLLTPSGAATNRYETGGIRYRFRLVNVAEMDAQEVLNRGEPCLLPFVPLMKGGRDCFDEAEGMLYKSELGRAQRSDLLTGMALLSGLIAKDLPKR